MNKVEMLSVDLCKANPDNIYVFGDNLIGKGLAGQAQIRMQPNSVGIPTKRLPSTCSVSYFSDKGDEWKAVDKAIRNLTRLRSQGYTIVFPKQGLGTGLAQMEERSPELFEHMNYLIELVFGDNYDDV